MKAKAHHSKSTALSRHQIIHIYNFYYETVTVVNYYNLGFKIQSQYSKDHAQPELILHFQAIHAFLTHAEYLILLQQQNTRNDGGLNI
jgi:hypothetical protein